jgi:hypothetical protein
MGDNLLSEFQQVHPGNRPPGRPSDLVFDRTLHALLGPMMKFHRGKG